MKHIVLLWAVAVNAIAGTLFAQNNGQIKGVVMTSDGHPAAYISVILEGTQLGSYTNQLGEFVLTAPAGKYKMAFFSIVCHRKEMDVVVLQGKVTDIGVVNVIENRTQLNEVVVTGQFAPQSIRNSVFKVRVINQQQILNKGAVSIQHLLNTELGIRMSNDRALGETDFELMGMGGNNVKVLIDGIPMLDRLTRRQSLSQVDINNIDRIEIVEGPMSVIYGTDALAGVINIITKTTNRDLDKPLEIGVRIVEESVGNEYSFATGKGSHSQHFNALYNFKNGFFAGAGFTHLEFGGWQGALTGRRKQWQPKRQYMPGARIGYKSQNFNIWYKADYIKENILTELDVNLVANTTSDREFLVDRYTHQLQTDWKANKHWSVAAAYSHQYFSRRTRTTNIDLNSGKKTLSLNQGAQDKTHFSSNFGRIVAVWKPLRSLSVQPGIEYHGTIGVGDRIAGEQQIFNAAFFVSAEYLPFQWLAIRPGFRSNFNSVFNAPKAVPALNVKASLSSDVDLRMSYGRGYRAPTLQELFYSFHDANHNIDGNPNLLAEFSDSYMSSLVWRVLHDENVRLTSTVSGFYNDFKNRITLHERVERPGFYWYFNTDIYKTTGFTIENTLTWNDFRASVNASYIGRYNKFFGDEKYAGQDPSMFRFSPEVSASVSYSHDRLGEVNVFYKLTGARKEYMIGSENKLTLVGLNSFQWADITYNKPITSFLRVNFGVRNLFNVTDVLNNAGSVATGHGTSAGGSMMGSGRSYFAGIAVSL